MFIILATSANLCLLCKGSVKWFWKFSWFCYLLGNSRWKLGWWRSNYLLLSNFLEASGTNLKVDSVSKVFNILKNFIVEQNFGHRTMHMKTVLLIESWTFCQNICCQEFRNLNKNLWSFFFEDFDSIPIKQWPCKQYLKSCRSKRIQTTLKKL